MANNERSKQNPEYNRVEHERFEEVRRENQERLRDNLERQAEKSPERNIEAARQEALEKALAHERKVETLEREASPAEKRDSRPASKLTREASFQKTMQEVRTEMSAPSRTFSKIIHNKVVEKVSETAGNTIARPNAVLSGALFAFILTLGLYLVAKNLGYRLSGFETIGAFILGWILGLTLDFLKIMITGRK